MARTLYICYFGISEPLVQTQVIPYLEELRKDGHEIELLTFEPGRMPPPSTEQSLQRVLERLKGAGISWKKLVYHKRPSALATAYDILRGALFVWNNIGRFDALHCRVHVPTLMAVLARRFSRRKPKIIFDIRGFVFEEYVDAGIWPKGGWLYRFAKRIEAWLMKEVDSFVVLTEKAREILFPESRENGLDKFGRPVEVIPCCVDFEKRFAVLTSLSRDEQRCRMSLNDRFVMAHVGALGGVYLTEEIADLVGAARSIRPNTFALFLTQSDPELIKPLLEARGFTQDDYLVKKAPSADVPLLLSAADVGISFVKATYATQSRSPTKIPEYLACGLPIIANSGVGDVDALIKENGVGVLLENFDEPSYQAAIRTVLQMGDVSERCRAVAKEQFGLEAVGGTRYRRLYQKLLQS
jgi:glycosyltransferase involved in cell wall biosynthesis